MNYIGIDPGKSGGIAVLNDRGVVGAWPMPDTERDTFDLIKECTASPDEDTAAVIEYVRSRPGQGVASMFTFGKSYGGLRMALVATGVPFQEVTPGSWQKAFGLTSQQHATQTAKKNANKARAQELFPNIKITHAIADALLLAEWLRRR